MSRTAQDQLRDAVLRQAVELRRYSLGLATRIANLLAAADAELSAGLTAKLARFEGRQAAVNLRGEAWAAILMEITEARAESIRKAERATRAELIQLGVLEAEGELDAFKMSIPLEVTFAAPSVDQLRAIVSARPFQGRFLRDWFRELEAQDGARVKSAIQLGMVQGEPIPDIVRRLVGTKRNMYADGILSITRRDATAVVRTAVNHVSNVARGYVWDANADIILARIWTATLDGRTSAVCRARDGHGVPVGDNALPLSIPKLTPPGARPPAHINCRSIMTAILSPEGLIGDRPFVVDTRTPDRRRIDFREEAKRTGRTEKAVRDQWTAENIGRLPAATTYNDFLSRQSAAFQDEVLGPTRGKLFRTGKITLDEFVDRRGSELTLEQLAQRRPDVFRSAGLSAPGG